MTQATSDELAAMSDGALLDAAARDVAAIEERIGRVVIGQRATVRALLAGVLCEGHTLIVGVPGLAKTLLVHTLSDALGWSFRRIQFTPDLMPADIVGMELLDESDGKRAMRFVPGPVFGNLILADEINRCPPKTQAALLEAMQERQVTSMGTTHRLAPPFVVVATQNPIEQEGTYPLPEAQLDRFALGLWMDYPGEEEEVAIASATTGPTGGGGGAEGAALEPIASVEVMRAYQALVRRVPASEPVVRYAVKLARATRPGRGNEFADMYVEWGAGPRASQMLVLVGKALAVMDGRPSPSMADVREAAAWVLRHRVLPSYEAAAEGLDALGIVGRVVAGAGDG
ncbi:MAG: MoxR family ATPase [Planctomycetota bacterium]